MPNREKRLAYLRNYWKIKYSDSEWRERYKAKRRKRESEKRERKRIEVFNKWKQIVDSTLKDANSISYEEILSYIAGFIDGDGTISFSVYKSPPNGVPTITPYVSITNNNKEILEFCRTVLKHGNVIGGKGNFIRTSGKKTAKWRTRYELKIYSVQNIILVLSKLYRYLHIKKKIAELMMQYCLIKIRYMRSKKTKLLNEEIELLERIRALQPRNMYYLERTKLNS